MVKPDKLGQNHHHHDDNDDDNNNSNNSNNQIKKKTKTITQTITIRITTTTYEHNLQPQPQGQEQVREVQQVKPHQGHGNKEFFNATWDPLPGWMTKGFSQLWSSNLPAKSSCLSIPHSWLIQWPVVPVESVFLLLKIPLCVLKSHEITTFAGEIPTFSMAIPGT